MGVAKDNYPRDGNTFSFVIGFAEVEVDVETGKVTLVDYLSVGDVGTVVNPRSLIAQLNGGSCLGIAHALCQKWVIDPQYGVTLARRFHYNKPLTILDIPNRLQATALDLPIPRRRSARAASASLRSAPATAPCSTRLPMRSAWTRSAAPR